MELRRIWVPFGPGPPTPHSGYALWTQRPFVLPLGTNKYHLRLTVTLMVQSGPILEGAVAAPSTSWHHLSC